MRMGESQAGSGFDGASPEGCKKAGGEVQVYEQENKRGQAEQHAVFDAEPHEEGNEHHHGEAGCGKRPGRRIGNPEEESAGTQ